MDDKLNLDNYSPMWTLHSIEEDFQRLYNHYRSVVSTNEYLKEKIKEVKSEAYKDEELSKMKEKYDQMSKDYYRGFPISEEEDKKINKWIDKQIEKYSEGMGAIGGRFKYQFITTGIGTVGTVIDSSTGDSFTFRILD